MNDLEEPIALKIFRKCPRCKGMPKTYSEIYTNHTMDFAADKKEIDQIGYMGMGHPTHVIAICGDCDYCWRLRGIIQITALHKD